MNNISHRNNRKTKSALRKTGRRKRGTTRIHEKIVHFDSVTRRYAAGCDPVNADFHARGSGTTFEDLPPQCLHRPLLAECVRFFYSFPSEPFGNISFVHYIIACLHGGCQEEVSGKFGGDWMCGNVCRCIDNVCKIAYNINTTDTGRIIQWHRQR